MSDREAVGPGVVTHLLEAQGAWIADQLTEDTVPAREVADARDLVLGEAGRQEALQCGATFVEDSEGSRPSASAGPTPNRCSSWSLFIA
jgi:hypothetical protein